jgi:hypothetical protein
MMLPIAMLIIDAIDAAGLPMLMLSLLFRPPRRYCHFADCAFAAAFTVTAATPPSSPRDVEQSAKIAPCPIRRR